MAKKGNNTVTADLVDSIRRQCKNSKGKEVVEQKRKIYPKYKDCEICGGTLYDEDGNMCDCMRLHLNDLKYKEANIGEKYWNANLQFYKKHMRGMQVYIGGKRTPKNVDFFTDYIRLYISTFPNRLQDGRGFLLSGECGCGKTGALCFIVKELKLKGYKVYYIDTNELLETISASYDKDEDATRKLSKLKTYDLLVLDDFGSEYGKDTWRYNIFLKLLKSRYAKNLPTLMSTNLEPDSLFEEFSEDVAPRLSSVFAEVFEVLLLEGTKDMRKHFQSKKSLYDDMSNESEE